MEEDTASRVQGAISQDCLAGRMVSLGLLPRAGDRPR
jgi:hypothetical protein